MISSADKWEKYQFTYEERVKILACVKEYFNLTKQERCKRRYLDLENEDKTKGWFNQWFTKRNSFNYKIPVESWPDEINNVDLEEIEQIYLDENYYQLLPFETALNYTEKVMSKFLNFGLAESSNETVKNSPRISKIKDFVKEGSNKTSVEKKSNRKEISNKERFNYNQNLNNKRADYNESSSGINSVQSSNCKEKLTNQLSLIKQRLVNKRVWLNEQAMLNKHKKDQNDNYLTDLNDLDNFQNDWDYDLNEETPNDKFKKNKEYRKVTRTKTITTNCSDSKRKNKKKTSKPKMKKRVTFDERVNYTKTNKIDDPDCNLEDFYNSENIFFNEENNPNKKKSNFYLIKNSKKTFLIFLIILSISYLKFMNFL